MPRRFINQLAERDQINEVFLIADKQLRANRQGNLYLQLRLADKSGQLTGMLWNATEATANLIESGQYARIHGTMQLYNNQLQMIVTKVERVPSEQIDEADFATLQTADVDRLAKRLVEMLREVRNVHLRSLAESFLVDEAFMTKFTTAPAGVKNHHAFRGGLLEHVVSLMELCSSVAPHYAELDPDLLRMGAFLHDAGKIDELTYEKELGYSDEGQLIGHVVMAVGMVAEKSLEAAKLSGEAFPRELLLRLQHMIVSHHGEYAFGSPKLPMTLEAMALHYLDNLDAKMHAVKQLLQEDSGSESHWTSYNAPLSRKFFKGTR
ncbi:3'-5' exoribonuclease YhaM [Anatilimnocola aggregata]|uniref:3'-5' exoribonuclease YhaM n=1 Tax=Anatilimnocola aggregata TaxID=2528021 RepID=A0A517Y6Q0_9BACT|nr:HD domain-containing protein [Anatilimnocola aggregata]QDU25917.1 3'-5' exoribonuclease YhaM [Anatilimnocola aggregata]